MKWSRCASRLSDRLAKSVARWPRKTTVVRENQSAILVAQRREPWHCSRTETGQPGSDTEGQPEVDVVRENRGRRKLEAGPSAVSRQRAAMTADVARSGRRKLDAAGTGSNRNRPRRRFPSRQRHGGPETDQPECGTLGCRGESPTAASSRKRGSTKVQVRV